MKMSETTTATVKTVVYARSFGDEVVLLNFARGEYFALDAVGARIFTLVEKGSALGVIADAIVAEFDVDRARAFDDIVDLVAELQKNGLVDITW